MNTLVDWMLYNIAFFIEIIEFDEKICRFVKFEKIKLISDIFPEFIRK